MRLGRQILAVVGELEFTGDDPAGEFLSGASALLTAALGKLPEARREEFLDNIERGALREGVEAFITRCAARRLVN
jgi:hypothetical protein